MSRRSRRLWLGAWPPSPLMVLLRTALLNPQQASCGTSGLFLVGGSVYKDDPPVLTFGSDPSATMVLTLSSAGVTLARAGVTEAAFDGEVTRLPGTTVSTEVAAELAYADGTPQWALWDLDTFDSAATGQWSVNDRSACGAPNDLFLGGHCKFGATRTERVYTQLPPHSRVRIHARVHFFDDWQGEAVAIQVDGQTVWARSHKWCSGFLQWMCLKYGVDSCGRDTPDQLSLKAEATLQHSSPSLRLAFHSDLPEGADACGVSWGVDDVSVELL